MNPKNTFDIDGDALIELPVELVPGADPFLCTVLSGLNSKSCINVKLKNKTDTGNNFVKDLMDYWMDVCEVSEALYIEKFPLTAKGKLLKDQVDECRDYYLNRFVSEKLSGKQRMRSEFIHDVSHALEIKGIVKAEYAGLYHKLLDFYQNDKTWDMLVDVGRSADNNYSTWKSNTFKLKFICKSFSSSNKTKKVKTNYVNYFFMDGNRFVYKYSVYSGNALIPFLENYFETEKDHNSPYKSVSCHLSLYKCPVPYYGDDFKYYEIRDFALLNYNSDD